MPRPPVAAPLSLRPADVVFSAASQSAGMMPTLKWVIGPVIALVVAFLTAFAANHLWPPEAGSGAGGPSFLAAKRAVQIISDPAGAEVQVDGVPLEEKTPTEIKGNIGKSARVRLVLPGHDPYEATILFTKDPRPPLRVHLVKAGSRPKAPDDSDADEKPAAAADDSKAAAKEEKEAKPDKVDKKDKGDKKAEVAAGEEEEGGKKKKHKKKDKEKGEGEGGKTAKAALTILVRPWAIVYLDGKKLQQTPLRNHTISPGSHKILLVNDTKGKREEIKLKVTAGEEIPEIKRNWE